MILVDSSVWIDHIRAEIQPLMQLFRIKNVMVHPFVIGEVALCSIKNRHTVLAGMERLPAAVIASNTEVRQLVERHQLFGKGVGYIDCHLLMSAMLSGADFWRRHKRLGQIAEKLGLVGQPG